MGETFKYVPLSMASVKDEFALLILSALANAEKIVPLAAITYSKAKHLLGIQMSGTKYPKPWIVLTSNTTQNATFPIHSLPLPRGAGP